ncbi:MAG: hypothetical protein KJ822_08215, partial [Proteobacteria bacterium]|nr:hypothetical protein [Pseudomonadota bacterium]
GPTIHPCDFIGSPSNHVPGPPGEHIHLLRLLPLPPRSVSESDSGIWSLREAEAGSFWRGDGM